MKDEFFLDLAKELLYEIRSGDETIPDEVRRRMSDPHNLFRQYVVVRRIGEGASAVVWQAWHLELRKYVALKLMRPKLIPEAALRFSQEAQVGAGLIHPNIIRVHNYGVHHGTHFIEMDSFDAVNFEEFLRSDDGRARPLRDKIALLVPVCRALSYAHGMGVIHRDVNPKNILLGRDDLIPRLTDFGLAKVLEGLAGVTETGRILGTPAYMSPEQARGQEVGSASDIYSLGTLLFRTAVDRLPYTGETAVAITREIDRTGPLRPSILKPDISPALERILLKAMARSPMDRYAGADRLADDLERWIAGRAISVAPPEPGNRVLSLVQKLQQKTRLAGLKNFAIVAAFFLLVIAYLDLRFDHRRLKQELESKETASGAVSGIPQPDPSTPRVSSPGPASASEAAPVPPAREERPADPAPSNLPAPAPNPETAGNVPPSLPQPAARPPERIPAGMSAFHFRAKEPSSEETLNRSVQIVRRRLEASPEVANGIFRFDPSRRLLTLLFPMEDEASRDKIRWLVTRPGVFTARALASRETCENTALRPPDSPRGFEWALINLEYPRPAGETRHWLVYEQDLGVAGRDLQLAWHESGKHHAWSAPQAAIAQGDRVALMLDGEIFWYGPWSASGARITLPEGSPQFLIPAILQHGPLLVEFEPVENADAVEAAVGK